MSEPAELFETKSDYAYRQVRDRILSGELLPGAVIQQRELASQIGISTTPLREALRRLKSEGLVELDAHRDARISSLRAEEARDLLELRKSLDPVGRRAGGPAPHQGGHPGHAGRPRRSSSLCRPAPADRATRRAPQFPRRGLPGQPQRSC